MPVHGHFLSLVRKGLPAFRLILVFCWWAQEMIVPKTMILGRLSIHTEILVLLATEWQ